MGVGGSLHMYVLPECTCCCVRCQHAVSCWAASRQFDILVLPGMVCSNLVPRGIPASIRLVLIILSVVFGPL